MSKQKNTNKKSKINGAAGILLLVVFIGIFVLYFLQEPAEKSKSYYNTAETKTMSNSYNFTKEGELVFSTVEGDSIAQIDIEIAETNDDRTVGLMYRKSMGENEGMLFIFPYEEPQSFWMENTAIPLDIIYVNSKREIVKIHKNTTPYSRQSYPSVMSSIFVVEVNAGFTDKYNIKEGDKIFWVRKK